MVAPCITRDPDTTAPQRAQRDAAPSTGLGSTSFWSVCNPRDGFNVLSCLVLSCLYLLFFSFLLLGREGGWETVPPPPWWPFPTLPLLKRGSPSTLGLRIQSCASGLFSLFTPRDNISFRTGVSGSEIQRAKTIKPPSDSFRSPLTAHHFEGAPRGHTSRGQ
ncbi:hypothetical protein F5148DRAFT_779733 [Russula earlei]|uniref:Uncharacterized protein n=1 Tax=Russula earlei TaxID=71964 RepID=A0ACC0UCA2_9AGAM|nr:hypothetical protein F5148DRAFT_779733 [Russula earlei]